MAQAPRHKRTTQLKTFLFGAPYYPEHWGEAEWKDDPSRMAAAGVNVVRMGEFSWHLMEKTEGRYDFSFYDEHIARLGKAGIQTILCTPTAAPPRWLTCSHPETRRIDRDGKVMEHGTRQHCCTNSPIFRQYSRKISTAMAGHFAANPNVIGWQTDNEWNCHFALCYCPECTKLFQEWCRKKYGNDIEKLNKDWGNAFWSLEYNSFEEVLLPYDRPARANPGHMLDYTRFVSDSTCDINREQAQIIRKANPAWFVTHNGLMGYIDYAKFTQDMDFLGVDIYPGFIFDDHHFPALHSDKTRSFGGNFIVPELESGPGGQVGAMLQTPVPGQMRLWGFQCAAHGADGVMHFRWRSCRFGAEEYWCGVLDHDNKPRRRYEEFAREGNDFKRIGPEILGTSVAIDAAVLIEYDQDQAHAANHLSMPSPLIVAETAHRELWRRKLPVGVVEATDSFDGLKLLVLPSFTMMDEELVGKLEKFVRGGGVLLISAWAGTRDRRNQITPLSAPGLLAGLAGATVEEFSVQEDGQNVIELADGAEAKCCKWYELLEPTTAKVVGKWTRAHLAGKAAMTLNQVGSGKVFYVGTYLSKDNVAAILDQVLAGAGISPVLPDMPEPVEATVRMAAGKRLLFLLNHSVDEQTVMHLPAGTELISGKSVLGKLTLPGKDVAVIKVRE